MVMPPELTAPTFYQFLDHVKHQAPSGPSFVVICFGGLKYVNNLNMSARWPGQQVISASVRTDGFRQDVDLIFMISSAERSPEAECLSLLL
mmetsp:Transcript_16551/g.29517  ORF Transcript_16551/g.29517 Transcript_16551/m.29517 type:complete len:91 (-) Transcript_16551:497-769(-)